MDRLAERLREDAGNIDAEISAELDHRIHASLTSVQPQPVKPAPREVRALSFWWASSLTGLAAAIAVIVVINLNRAPPPTDAVTAQSLSHIVVPQIDFEVEAATLTDPLAQELENLRDDLRKVEETVRNDVRFDF
jgi:hypothetical protein